MTGSVQYSDQPSTVGYVPQPQVNSVPPTRSVPANVMLQLPNQIRLLNDSFLDQIPNR
jgi:hypothetical protein